MKIQIQITGWGEAPDEPLISTSFGSRGRAPRQFLFNRLAKAIQRAVPAFFALLLLALPAVVQAQFLYTTNNGTITITGYTGPGGAVTIPDTINGLSVTSVGDFAFAYTSLTNVTIPDSVTSIGVAAFGYCFRLTVINVDAANLSYSSVAGVLFNKSQTKLIQYPAGKVGSYTIPDGIVTIGDRAFESCYNLTNVTIGNGVTSIGMGAFDVCSSLPDITIPNSVTNVGDDAFVQCSGLTNVTIGTGVINIGGEAFWFCTGLTSVTIPDSVISIEGSAFAYCSSLTNAMIGNNVTDIGNRAFGYCMSLTGVYFSGDAPTAGPGVFTNIFWTDDGPRWFIDPATIYYLPNTTGWSSTFAGRPTALWLPQMQTGDASFGVRTNQFGFNIAWASGQTVVVEACTNLANSIWQPVQTNTLTSDSVYFSDPQWTTYPARFYRLRSP